MIYETRLQFQRKSIYNKLQGDIVIMFEAIIFDLDGTLLDTLEDIGSAANAALIGNGFPGHRLAEYRKFVGEGARRLIERALPAESTDVATVDVCLRDYLRGYGQVWNRTTRLYAGIDDMLSQLTERKIKLSILSNKTREFTQKCARHFLSRWKFEAIIGEGPETPAKPNPEGALRITELLRTKRNRILYAGDSGVDMRTAKAAGLFAIGVTWGFRPRDELLGEGADTLAEQPADIVNLIGQ